MTRLDRLLKPESVAVVGGSWGRSVIEQLQRIQFRGAIWPVHPSHHQISGLKCYPGIESLPQAPDACFVGVNRQATLEVVSSLSAMGCGGAVCFASGFSEATAEDRSASRLQQQLLECAGDMPIIGPNCYGFINYLDGVLLWPDLHGGQRVDRGVAIITQSSNIAISLTMQRRALPIAYVLTAGNQAQISIAELGMAALQDERVTALGMHIEGFGDIRAFEALAQKAAELGKSIVVIKAGRSQQSQQAMISHTNSLSGSDVSSDALLQRLGVARVDSLPALLEALKLMHVFGGLGGNTIASMSCSGGEAGLMADAVVGRPLRYLPLDATKTEALRNALGPMVALANPLDYHTYIWNKLPEMTATFSAMLADGADLSFLVIDFPHPELPGGESWMVAVQALIEAKKRTGAAVAIVATLPENIPDEVARQLLDEGIPSLYGIEVAMEATVALSSIGKSSRRLSILPVTIAAEKAASVGAVTVQGIKEQGIKVQGIQEQGNTEQVNTVPADAQRADVEQNNHCALLTEHQAKQVLQQAGMEVPRFALVKTCEEAGDAALAMGYPVVLKLVGEAHKTEHDGIALNLINDEMLTAASEELFTKADCLLIEPFCDGAIAELLVGIVRETSGVLMLTIGAGGVMTELLRDNTSLLLPVSTDEIEFAINQLKIAALLNGYRNKPAANVAAVADQIKLLCDWAVTHADDLHEVEVNPLLCQCDRAVVVDALIRMTEPT